ncbi:MAG TPA: BON domain-containing protein [Polyangiaceae bacterium]
MKRIVLLALATLGTACAHHDDYDPRVAGWSGTTTQTTSSNSGPMGAENAMPEKSSPAPMSEATVTQDATPSTMGTVRPGDVTPPMKPEPQNLPPVTAPPATTPPAAPPANRPTATDQKNDKSDLKITAAIRRAVVRDGALSFRAKNVTIITTGGKVVLRGAVKTEKEKAEVEARARAVDGVTDVDNQLVIKP